MQYRKRLLRFGLRRNKSHGRTRGRFANGLGVDKVVLIALHERLHKLGRDELDLMIEARQFACEVMCAGTGFHHSGTAVERGEKLDELLATHLLAKHSLTVPVLAVEVKRMLAQVDSYQRHVFHDGLQK
jgi:hypothetical protein